MRGGKKGLVDAIKWSRGGEIEREGRRGGGMRERWGEEKQMRTTEGRKEIDERTVRGMGSWGKLDGRVRTWGMRVSSRALKRKCVSIIILFLGSADHIVAPGDQDTQYRSHVPWWMMAWLQCQPTQRSPPAGTNHSATAPINTQANTTNGAIYSVRLAWCTLNRLLLPSSWDLSMGSCCFCKSSSVHK